MKNKYCYQRLPDKTLPPFFLKIMSQAGPAAREASKGRFSLAAGTPARDQEKTRKKAGVLLILITRRKGQNHEIQHHFKTYHNLLPVADQTRMAYAFEILKILCLQLLTNMLI